MKFNDGYWLLRHGVTATYAKEAFAVETSDSTVSVAALSRPVEHRGSHLNTPTITVDLQLTGPRRGRRACVPSGANHLAGARLPAAPLAR